MQQLVKFGHYSLLTNHVYTLIFALNCGAYSCAVIIPGAEFNEVNTLYWGKASLSIGEIKFVALSVELCLSELR